MDKRVASVSDASPVTFLWGRITWLHSGETGAVGLTVGEVIIDPGQSNAVHAHPNCEEVLYLISGELDHTRGEEETSHLTPGMSILIPKGVRHNARCTSVVPARMLVVYSSAYREVTEE